MKIFGSNNFREMISHVPRNDWVLSESLVVVDAAEGRLRAIEKRIGLLPGDNMTEEVSSSFREVTWHRVLLAELLRRSLRQNSLSNKGTSEGSKMIISEGAEGVIITPLLDRKLYSHLNEQERNPDSNGLSESVDYGLIHDAYLPGRQQRMFNLQRNIFFDHRIRRDALQQRNLKTYIGLEEEEKENKEETNSEISESTAVSERWFKRQFACS